MTELKELNKAAIGMRVRQRRELLGLSREELAARLGVTPKFVGDIEYGDKGVSMKNLYRLKQILGVSADFLLEGLQEDASKEKEMTMLRENIMGSLSVCSARQLGVMEKIARLYVEGIVRDEPEDQRMQQDPEEISE